MVLRLYKSAKYWLNEQFFIKKLDNPLGYLLLIAIALVVSYLISSIGLRMGVVLLGIIVGIPILAACFLNLNFGISTLITSSFFIMQATKYANLPFGTLMDALIFVMMFGILVRQIKERNWAFAKNPISYVILLWIAYNILQIINPWAGSTMAWLYTVRSVAVLLSLYFIACYAFTSLDKIIGAIKLILILGFITAAYGIKQEIFGYTSAEMAWLSEYEERFQLVYQWGRLRVISLFADPTTLGIMMVYLGTFCLILASSSKIGKLKKLVLVVFSICMFLTMAFGGSRTPVLLIPIGFAVVMLLTLKKSTITAVSIFLVLGTAFMYKSSGNPIIWRIQSALNFTQDASVMVRMRNQKFIQPFIQTHPFGGGLGSTGLWGRRFTPDSMLAKFAHDSGYVRIAVELGLVGMLIYMLLLYVILRTSVYYYLRVKDPLIKSLYLGLTTVMFILMVASYPQEAIVQLPTSIVFYIFLAAIVKLKDFDVNFQKEKLDKPNEQLLQTNKQQNAITEVISK